MAWKPYVGWLPRRVGRWWFFFFFLLGAWVFLLLLLLLLLHSFFGVIVLFLLSFIFGWGVKVRQGLSLCDFLWENARKRAGDQGRCASFLKLMRNTQIKTVILPDVDLQIRVFWLAIVGSRIQIMFKKKKQREGKEPVNQWTNLLRVIKRAHPIGIYWGIRKT